MKQIKRGYSHFKNLLKIKREQRYYQQLSTLLFSKKPNEGLYFNSLDFLDLNNNAYIQEQALKHLISWGSGTNSKNLVMEQIEHQYNLEEKISKLNQRDHTFVYQANATVQKNLISSFIDEKTLLLIDETFASKVKHIHHNNYVIIKRNDLESLERELKKQTGHLAKIFIADSICTFTGDFLDLEKICTLCKQYNTVTIIDDTNSIGLFGVNGMGLCSNFSQVDIVTGSFAKTVGTYACFLSTNDFLSDYFAHTNQAIDSFHLLPPASLALLNASIDLMGHMSLERDRLKKLSSTLKKELTNLGFSVCQNESNIVSLNFKNEKRALNLSHALTKDKIFHLTFSSTLHRRAVTNLRFILNCNHTKIDLKYLLQTIERRSDALMIQVV